MPSEQFIAVVGRVRQQTEEAHVAVTYNAGRGLNWATHEDMT